LDGSGEIELTGTGLSPADVIEVARGSATVTIAEAALRAMADSASIVARLADRGEPAYGVTTGFGSLATVPIPGERRAQLQRSLLRSHAAGMGEAVELEAVRAMMLLRARTLTMGYSGARPEVAERIVDLLNARLTPVVPEHGSLGASGDLAPLAHCALALIGEGEVFDGGGARRPAADALAEAGIEPLALEAKEGLALINGTDGILGMLLLAIADLRTLVRAAEAAAAMSVEALLGTDRAFAGDLIALRPQPGQAVSAANLRRLLEGSAIVASHRYDDPRVQDAYSLRCAPQVTGAARDALEHAERTAAAELESAIDNPMVLPDGRIESCGNFHGAPLGLACDLLAIAGAEVGAIAERRTDRLLDASRSQGLPAFLADDPGVDSGLMIAQYTQAAMVAENRRLAAPASVDSLPTSAMQEDHVSMAWGAARKLRRVVDNLVRIVAVELAVAARALDLRAPLEPAPGTAAARVSIRGVAPGPGPDRWLAPELNEVERLVGSGELVTAIEAEIGELG
jgi:histidine ammonia-lyase